MSNAIERVGVIGAGQMGAGIAEVSAKAGADVVVYEPTEELAVAGKARIEASLERAVSKGKLLALSTPFGKRGWFYEAWSGADHWNRVKVTADQCPRISPEFLAEEVRALGERWYRQEYACSFEETIDAVFSSADIAAALTDSVKPLFGG